MNNLDQARAWAQDNIDDFYEGERVYAVCEVIQSLPDHWIDAEKVREVLAEQYMKLEGSDTKWINAATIESLLTPPLPTLADMTPEEREACQWMQAKIHRTDDLEGVIFFLTDDRAKIMFRDGTFVTQDHEDITPLPDLPRLEWPAQEPRLPETPPAETLNNTSSDTPRNPRPEDVPAGEAWIVQHEGLEWVGVRANDFRIPWSITNMDGLDYRDVDDAEITLVSRLVPEVKP